MKKLIVASFLAFFSTVLMAQKFQIFAGGLSSSIDYKNFEDPLINDALKKYNGFFVGAGAKIELRKRLFFMPTLQGSFRGYKVDVGSSALNVTNRNAHIDLHAMLSYKVFGPISVQGGGFLSAPLSEQTKIGDNDWQTAAEKTLSTVDYGLVWGLNLQLGRIGLFGRFNYGLGKYYDIQFTDVNGTVDADAKVTNRFSQLGVSFRI